MAVHENQFIEYERRKKEIIEKNLSPSEYQKEIRLICEELDV